MDWTPTIRDRQGPLYQRIVNALAEDIEAGRLRQGQALPTHRKLATMLGVDLTTVTRAYTEARRQGLTEATVGRGTFVKARPMPQRSASATPGIDLSMNLPPQPPEADLDGRLARTLADIRARLGLAAYLTYQQPGGTPAERQVAADWLRGSLGTACAPNRLILSPGTQATLFCLLSALVPRGGAVLTEQLTYAGFKVAAAAAGVDLVGIDMDGEGIVPAALDRAARAGPARIVYLTPTMHNPTTATMPASRRERIAEIVAKRGLTLIEDDPYAFLAPGLAPISSLIPERSYLAASLSKCVTPGLRMSLVVASEAEAAAQLAALLRATLQMSVPLMAAVATSWMRDGSVDAIVSAIRAEAAARQALASEALIGHAYAAHPNGHHIWMPLPATRPAVRFAEHLRNRGLAVVTSEAFAADGAPPNAIRLGLGAARNRAELARALAILAEALAERPPDGVVV